jgi:SpoVK/Ycf46/Vps4 family AAA+-type ATPase
MFYALGILPGGQLIEVTREDLVAKYVGGTAPKTRQVVESAMGGVLFIDEAYTLASGDNANDFGREAINALLKPVEERRGDFVCIIAGYTKEMLDFFDSNSGIPSRFNKRIEFRDYEPEQLTEIFRGKMKKEGYQPDTDADEKLGRFFEKMYKRVAERLSDEALKLGASEGEVERYATLGQNGDTANVWEGNRTAVLIPYAPYNRVNFRQECDTTYHQGDTFLFTLMADFMYQSGTRDAVVCLAARLDNDSVVSRVNHITVSGINQLRLNIDENRSVKELYGYFYLGKGNDKSATLKLMFLKDIRLIRFHQQRKENPVPKALPRDSIGLVRDSSLTRQRVKDSVISNNIKPKQE